MVGQPADRHQKSEAILGGCDSVDIADVCASQSIATPSIERINITDFASQDNINSMISNFRPLQDRQHGVQFST